MTPSPSEPFDPTGAPTPAEALGRSEAFVAFQERLSRVAKVDRPVLIIGERGTGKELAANRLHYLSERWRDPLVTLNCAALSPTLIESELFGHEAGAFTGATRRREGRFEKADGGTLFLDEIGSVPLAAQEKILRVVEYGVFERVGSSQSIRLDVRIIGATSADLPALADEGRFKWDLLDRLSFEVLRVPPLRERRDDILLLANHFAGRFARELGRGFVPQFSQRAARKLRDHPWPGNVRELKNAVERAVYAGDAEETDDIVLDPFKGLFAQESTPSESRPSPATERRPSPATPELETTSLPEAVERLKLRMLRQALDNAKYNQRAAAAMLGLTYHQFRGLYRRYADRLR